MPVSELEARMSGEEVAEWAEYFKYKAELEEKGPEAARTYDWREMQKRFKKVKELQAQTGKRVIERK